MFAQQTSKHAYSMSQPSIRRAAAGTHYLYTADLNPHTVSRRSLSTRPACLTGSQNRLLTLSRWHQPPPSVQQSFARRTSHKPALSRLLHTANQNYLNTSRSGQSRAQSSTKGIGEVSTAIRVLNSLETFLLPIKSKKSKSTPKEGVEHAQDLGSEELEQIEESDFSLQSSESAENNHLHSKNVIASEVIAQGKRLPQEFILSALEDAARARSPSALQFYLKYLEHTYAEESLHVIRAIRHWVENDDFRGVSGPRHRKEILTLLTGFPEGYPTEDQDPIVPNVLYLTNIQGNGQFCEDLLVSIGELAGSRAVLHLWNATLKRSIPRTESSPVPNKSSDGQIPIVDIVIQQLCRSLPPAPEPAWEIAAPQLEQEGGLKPETLVALLAWPEYLEKHGGLRQHMIGPVKEALERMAERIEHDLNLRWDMEMQKHQFTDEEFAAAHRDLQGSALESTDYEGEQIPETADEKATPEHQEMGSTVDQNQVYRDMEKRREGRRQWEQRLNELNWNIETHHRRGTK